MNITNQLVTVVLGYMLISFGVPFRIRSHMYFYRLQYVYLVIGMT